MTDYRALSLLLEDRTGFDNRRPQRPKPADRIADMGAIFAQDTEQHVLTILHDDRLYRHVRCARPGTGINHFELVTWPGYLAVGGDMDGYTFARIPDMFAFFRPSRAGINPGYWSQKLTSSRDRAKAFSQDKFRQMVTEHFVDEVRSGNAPLGLGRAIREELLSGYADTDHIEGARQALDGFTYKGWRFHDAWEWDLTDWDYTFLRACYAITWGITGYDKARAATTAGPYVGDAGSAGS